MSETEQFDINFKKICRICLKNNQTLEHVGAIYNERIKYIEMLEYLIENQICNNDYGEMEASYICTVCTSKLILSYEFKQQCTNSNEFIIKLCSNNKKTTIVTSESEVAHSNENNPNEVILNHDPDIQEDSNSPASLDDDFTELEEKLNIIQVVEVCSDEEINIPLTSNNSESQRVSSTNSLRERHCLKCNIMFTDSKSYNIHYGKIHRQKVLCPLCGKLVTMHGLHKHLSSTIHNKKKEHLCTECGKSFTLIENLEQHYRIHSGDKRYTCDYCGKKFIHWNSKRSHIRTFHTGEKKYECHICGIKFAQSSNLFRHIRSHTGEMPHECSYCQKKFKTSHEMKNHLVVHTKERNQLCKICHKAFGTKKSLAAHIKIHTGERNYVCTVCSKAFTQAHVLRTHLKTHPNCPTPPPGAILSQKALKKGPRVLDTTTKFEVASES